MRDMMWKLKLTVNETKTRVCRLPEEKFDFLGYTFGRCYSPKTGRAYLGTVPSKKRVNRICEAISEMTGRNQTLLDPEMVVAKLNRKMNGWANYFCLGPVSKAYRAVERHARKRLRQWLCDKHKVRGRRPRSSPTPSCTRGWAWSASVKRTAQFSVGDLVRLSPRAGCGRFRPSGSMSGVWKRSMVRLVRHRQTKGSEPDRPNLNHRVTPRLHQLVRRAMKFV